MTKTVLVTGAAKRLGRAIALDLAAHGWNVAIHYHGSAEEADEAAQAASSPDTQIFLGVGTLFLLPVILIYTAWSYWVFRGKARGDIGYH